jgi:uncharacterized membrane protein YqaE (UPF0057 family)
MFENIINAFSPFISGLSPVGAGFALSLCLWFCGYCLGSIFNAFRAAAGCGGLDSAE